MQVFHIFFIIVIRFYGIIKLLMEIPFHYVFSWCNFQGFSLHFSLILMTFGLCNFEMMIFMKQCRDGGKFKFSQFFLFSGWNMKRFYCNTSKEREKFASMYRSWTDRARTIATASCWCRCCRWIFLSYFFPVNRM
jgi:hypothetical protein